MYEGNPRHMWPADAAPTTDDSALIAALKRKLGDGEPALRHIIPKLLDFIEAGIPLDDGTIELATKLGRLEHSRWSTSGGHAFKTEGIAERPDHAPVVYYIRRGSMVKIGTTTNMHRRMRALLPEEVLAVEPGGQHVEFERHRQFSALRVEGQREWFHAGAPLQQHVARIRKAHGVPDASLPTLAAP